MATKPLSRYSDDPRLIDGKPFIIPFNERTHKICQLLACRKPWPYDFLPHTYIAALLGMGPEYLKPIIPAMARKPNQWLRRMEDVYPNRYALYGITDKTARKLRQLGDEVSLKEPELLAHKFLAIVIAASFEFSTRMHPISLQTEPRQLKFSVDGTTDRHIYPDWPTFRIKTPHQNRFICIEADMDTKKLTSNDPKEKTVETQLRGYLELLERGVLGDHTFICFVSINLEHLKNIMKLLVNIFKNSDYDHAYAYQFGFNFLRYTKYLSIIPPLTDWAVNWERVDPLPAFNFLKPEER